MKRTIVHALKNDKLVSVNSPNIYHYSKIAFDLACAFQNGDKSIRNHISLDGNTAKNMVKKVQRDLLPLQNFLILEI